MEPQIVHFLRSRDYQFVSELGSGACGRTVLLRDDILDQDFVCKKYAPVGGHKEELYQNFLREIKLLHNLNHLNVVRVFNYHLFPAKTAGYIVMERVLGGDIGKYLRDYPEQINEIFEQAIDGFQHLESNQILHRDIRESNLLVASGGILKIIDLGFGKQVETSTDFDKSINLNWWCELPNEFALGVYDFSTEIYFVGKLFEKVILENRIEHFKYTDILRRMCQRDSKTRINSFAEVQSAIGSEQFSEIDFTEEERYSYRYFADGVSGALGTLTRGKYVQDIERIRNELEAAYRASMLEESIPDASAVLRVLLVGTFTYLPTARIPVEALKGFVRLLKTSSTEKQRILISNLHSRLDATEPYKEKKKPATGFDDMDDDIPF